MKSDNSKAVANDISKSLARVKKLACGRSAIISGYGKVTAYRNSKGIRRFSLSNAVLRPLNGGNLSIKVIESDLNLIFN